MKHDRWMISINLSIYTLVKVIQEMCSVSSTHSGKRINEI